MKVIERLAISPSASLPYPVAHKAPARHAFKPCAHNKHRFQSNAALLKPSSIATFRLGLFDARFVYCEHRLEHLELP